MDGPVIQEATGAALAAGFRLRDTFTAVRAIAERTDVPILVMTYWNPVVQYGVDRYADDLAAGGAD
jgi:tryptophan synthase alpha chain